MVVCLFFPFFAHPSWRFFLGLSTPFRLEKHLENSNLKPPHLFVSEGLEL